MTRAAMTDTKNKRAAELLEHELTGRHGPLISNDDLRVALGYVSMDAFRQALARKPFDTRLSNTNRRGKYALVRILLSGSRSGAREQHLR